jgi:peroxiredoxin
MKKYTMWLPAVVMTILLVVGSLWAANPNPILGGVLPDIELPMPKDSSEKAYLGVSGFGSFKIPEIKARLVIIEIFNMYCPYCQREAPNVNQLHAKIKQDPALRDSIKIIGIGAGNSPYEVGIYKKKYNVAFPLFADKDYAIYNKIGEVRTPYFIGMKINPDGTHQIIYSKVGAFEGVDQFLSALMKSAGI